MRRALPWVCALALVGCASASKLEREAKIHDQNADAAARLREYDRASAEKSEAQRLHAKAVKRAYKEGSTEQVVIPTTPSQTPHEAPPLQPTPY
jgi:hypothetical protein